MTEHYSQSIEHGTSRIEYYILHSWVTYLALAISRAAATWVRERRWFVGGVTAGVGGTAESSASDTGSRTRVRTSDTDFVGDTALFLGWHEIENCSRGEKCTKVFIREARLFASFYMWMLTTTRLHWFLDCWWPWDLCWCLHWRPRDLCWFRINKQGRGGNAAAQTPDIDGNDGMTLMGA